MNNDNDYSRPKPGAELDQHNNLASDATECLIRRIRSSETYRTQRISMVNRSAEKEADVQFYG